MIKKNINRYTLLLSSIVLIMVPELFYRMGFLRTTDGEVKKELSTFINKKISEADRQVDRILADTAYEFNSWNENPVYLVTLNETPVGWSSEDILLPREEKWFNDTSGLKCADLGNGFFLYFTRKKDDRSVTALIRLTYHYKFNNRFLTERFADGLDIPEVYKIPVKGKTYEGPGIVIEHRGKKLFSLYNSDPTQIASHASGLMVGIQLAGIFLLLVSFVNFSVLFAHRSPIVVTCFVIVFLLLFKILLSVFSPIQLMRQSEIFNPGIFATSSIDASLGDFLLSFITLFCCNIYFYKSYFLFLQGKKQRFFFYVGLAVAVMIMSELMLIAGLKNLVINSKIDFFFKNIYSLNNYTIIGICSLGFGLYAVLFLLSRLRIFYLQYPRSLRLVIMAHLGFLAYMYYYWEGQYIYQLVLLSALMIVYITWPTRYALSPFNSTSVVLLVFSVISTTIFFAATHEKERNDRLLLAEKLSDAQDPDMEIRMSEIAPRISTDKYFRRLVNQGSMLSSEQVDDYLDATYFEKIAHDYDLNYMVFKNDSTPIFKSNYQNSELRKLNNIIRLHGKPTVASDLYFIYDKEGGIDYVGRIVLKEIGEDARLLVTMRTKKFPLMPGMNELLANNNQFYNKLLSDYSYIRFVNDRVVEQQGNFLYHAKAEEYAKLPSKFTFFSEDDYNHLIYRSANRSFVILSKPFNSWLTHVTSFSYILILFAIQFLLISIILFNKKIRAGFYNLSGKIQLAFIVLTILAMTMFGLTTQYTIGNQYDSKNFNTVAEKLSSISKELDYKSTSMNFHSYIPQRYIQQLLTEFSRIFNSDINYYSPDGLLVASSIPKIYRYRITGPFMNPVAYNTLKPRSSPRFIQTEYIGKMRYISGYVPYYSQDKKLLGYLNIPYFPRQHATTDEFSSLLMAIINIFVVLFAFTILLSVIVTQIIISPLNKIRESIAAMQLNKVNKPIIYKGKDELADLVKEYNNKVAELEKYAFYLAQNERESAWREMAKQVAHEIKNPLTPMKLNIQQMQRSLKPNDPDFETKINRISQSLIEQIDTLTTIASEFSSLAKMPGSKLERINYNRLVENIIELYGDEEHIRVDSEVPAQEIFVNADKDQLLRVLNNLLKNAQQAIPEEDEGIININVEIKDGKVVTKVIDNGIGMTQEQQEKIFQPNFTTKSTGSGLGLAMVKNIIEQHGGTIYFETKRGVGTTFVFEIPVVE